IAPEAPGAAAVAAAHLQRVAKAFGGDDADLWAAPLQQRIGADGRAMHNRPHTGRATERLQPIQEAQGFIAAIRRHLCRAELALAGIKHEQVGKGSADVDSDDDAATAHVRARAFAVAAISSAPSSRRTTL